MRLLALLACAGLGLALDAATTRAGGPKEERAAQEQRLRRFWHDYSDALRRYQKDLGIDWVAYYKNHGPAPKGPGILAAPPSRNAAPPPCLH